MLKIGNLRIVVQRVDIKVEHNIKKMKNKKLSREQFSNILETLTAKVRSEIGKNWRQSNQ